MQETDKYPVPSLTGDKKQMRFYRQAMSLYASGAEVKDIIAQTPFSKEEIEHWIATRWSERHSKEIQQAAHERIQLSSERIVNVVNDTLVLLENEVRKYKKASEETDMPVMKPEQLNSVVKTAKGLYEMMEMKEDKDAEREKKINNVKHARITSVDDFAKLLQDVDPFIDYSQIIEHEK